MLFVEELSFFFFFFNLSGIKIWLVTISIFYKDLIWDYINSIFKDYHIFVEFRGSFMWHERIQSWESNISQNCPSDISHYLLYFQSSLITSSFLQNLLNTCYSFRGDLYDKILIMRNIFLIVIGMLYPLRCAYYIFKM